MQIANSFRNSLPAPAPGIEVEDLENEICLYRSSTDDVLVLNQSAADIWRLIGAEDSSDQIVAILARAYGTEPAAIEADVHATLTDLVERGFVVWQTDTEHSPITDLGSQS